MASICLPPPAFWKDEFLGLTSQITFDHTDPIVKFGIALNSVALFTLFIRLLVSERVSGRPSQIRSFVLGYTLITCLFHGLRVFFDANRLLLVGAALHNLFEWGIIGTLIRKQTHVATFFVRAAAWIWLIVTISALVPSWTESVFVEQQTGIVCDYLLLGITTLRYFFFESKEKAQHTINRLAFWGSLTHFGQIWTLVFIVFGGRSHLIEGVIIFTAPITFYLYGEVAILWEIEAKKFAEEPKKPNSFNPYLTEDLWSIPNLSYKFYALLPIVALLSLGTIAGPAVVFKECPVITPTTNAYCVEEGPVIGFTTIKATPGQENALEQWIQEMIKPSRSEPGNVFYYFMKGKNPGEYAFVEKWASEDIKNKHLASAAVSSVFRSEHFVGMATELNLFGPWHAVEPCKLPQDELPPLELSWNYELRSPIAEFWKHIGNFSDASWVIGSSGCVVYGDLRNISMTSGSWVEVKLAYLNHDNHTFTYEITDYKPDSMPLKRGYTGTVHLVPSPKDPAKVTLVSYVNKFYPIDGFDRDTLKVLMIKDFTNRHEVIKSKFAYPPISQTCKSGECS